MLDEKQIILEVVEEISNELSPLHPSPMPGTELEVELGIGSLERLELVRRLEKRLGRSIDEGPVFEARYVSELLLRISDKDQLTTVPVTLSPRSLPAFPKGVKNLLEALVYQTEQQSLLPALVLLEKEAEVALPTYPELLLGARRVSAGLQALGVKPGDKVAVMLPTGVEFFYSFFGILNAGAVAVPLYPPFRLDQLEDFLGRQDAILKNCQAQVLITLSQFRPVVEVMLQRTTLQVVTSPQALSQSSPGPVYDAEKP